MKSEDEHLYNPSVWRLVIFLYVFPFALYLIGWSASYLTDSLQGRTVEINEGLSLFRGFVIGLTLFNILIIGFNRDYYAIKINSHSISGPTPAFGTKTISLDQLDYLRTVNQRGLERLLRVRRIWDTKGNSFSFIELFFKPEQIRDILKELSYTQKNMAHPAEAG
jgi:hypothetical protein